VLKGSCIGGKAQEKGGGRGKEYPILPRELRGKMEGTELSGIETSCRLLKKG